MAQGPALGAAGPPAPTPSWNKEFLSKHKGPKANSQSSPNPMGIKACAAQISLKLGVCLILWDKKSFIWLESLAEGRWLQV